MPTSDESDDRSSSPLAGDDEQYSFKEVQAVRGTEYRSITKWEASGWELVSQTPGKLRTKLTFRRPKQTMPRWLLPAAGGFLALIILIGVVTAMLGGSDDPPEAATSPTQSADAPPEEPKESEPVEPADQETLTVNNNKELAQLLRKPEDYDKSAAFAAKYPGRTIEFDGNVADLAQHGDYDTRYDILIFPGDYSKTTATGPNFQFRDVNIYDLNDSDDNSLDSVARGDNLHIVAEVGEFDSNTGLFLLEPVSTNLR